MIMMITALLRHVGYFLFGVEFSEYMWPFTVHVISLGKAWVLLGSVYSETCLYSHLRNRDNLGINDSYFSPWISAVHRNGPEK